MKTMSKVRGLLVGILAMGTLAACDGGSDGQEPRGADDLSTDGGEITIATVADLPEVGDACEKVVNMIGASGQLIAGQVEADVAMVIISDFVAAVPDEIRADAEVLADAYRAYIEMLSEYSGDLGAAAADPQAMEVLSAMDSAETGVAYQRVEQYSIDACGFAG